MDSSWFAGLSFFYSIQIREFYFPRFCVGVVSRADARLLISRPAIWWRDPIPYG